MDANYGRKQPDASLNNTSKQEESETLSEGQQMAKAAHLRD